MRSIGGTAINLFVRDLPRLSVDTDLAYLPVQYRDTILDEIGEALERIASSIDERKHDVRTQRTIGDGRVTKLAAGRGKS